MPYDKNRGRAAGTPGFYKNIGQKYSHGENTGEWSREERARHGGRQDEGKRFESGRKFDDERPIPRYGKPVERKFDDERHMPRYGKPVERSFDDERPAPRYGKPVERKFDDERPMPRYGKPVERKFDDERPMPRYGKPVERKFDDERPAPRYGRPVERSFDGDARRSNGRGTRDFSASPDRPIYQNAFEPAQTGMAPRMPERPAMRDAEEQENLIVGRNPIREAIKNGRELERLLVQRGELSGSAREIIAKAREQKVVVQEVDKARLDAIYPNHQGMIAFASAAGYSTVEDMLALAKERNEPPFLIVLDGITDPHNLGAIIRTAECAGAHGVILQQRRSVGLTPAAVKAAAGAAEYMKVAKVVNITRTLADLKKQGIWVIGADMDGQALKDTDLTGAAALVIGAEGEGISRLVKDECDLVVSLPMRGHIQSLNASVAAGVLMYAVRAARGD